MCWNSLHRDFYSKNFQAYEAGDPSKNTSLCDFATRIPEGGHILDFGCASGRDLAYFLECGFQAKGFDLSPDMIKRARKKGLDCYDACDFAECDFKMGYHGIYASASLHHIEEARQQELFRIFGEILQMGGVLYASYRNAVLSDVRREYYQPQPKVLEEFLLGTGLVIESFQNTEDHMGRSGIHWIEYLLKKR